MQNLPKTPLATPGALPRPDLARQGKRHPPGPRGRHLLGSLLEVRTDRLRFVRRALHEHGDLVGFRMGPKRLFLLSHPDHFRQVLCDNPGNYTKGVGLVEARPLLGEGLLTSEGELAATQRRRLQAAFSGPRLKAIGNEMSAAVQRRLDSWDRPSREGEPVDFALEMVTLALDVLESTLLRGDLVSHAHEIHQDLTVLTRWAMERMTALFATPTWWPTSANRRARRALGRLERLVESVVEARAHAPEDEDDLLSILLDPEQGLDARQIRDEILTFLLAGHETTAAALAWACHLLSRHPEIQERLHEEVESVLGGRTPEMADFPHLRFTKAVFDETIRLYPPVWMIPRRSVDDDEIGGFHIPGRSDVLLCAYTLHRHPELWSDPDTFDPDRFLAEDRPPPGAFLPFGAGSRSCLGSRFSTLEAVLTLAGLAQRFRLEPRAGATIEAEASLTLRPLGALPLRVVGR